MTQLANTTLFPTPGESEPSYATIREVADASSGIRTRYAMSVGDSFVGLLDRIGDRDMVRVDLTAGQTYSITLTGGSLADPFLYLYNRNGGLIATADDIQLGVVLDSEMVFTATSSGPYYVAAGAYADSLTGTYTLSVTPRAPLPRYSLAEIGDQLSNDFWVSQGESARAFTDARTSPITVNITQLDTDGQRMARWALDAWTEATGLRFSYTSGAADITYDDSDSGAYATSSVSGGSILSSRVNISTNWLQTYGSTIDGYGFQTYIHETGHALGLGHAGNYNGTASFASGASYLNDSWHWSVMSYFSQSENPNTRPSFAYVVTPMLGDMRAMDTLYGPATGTRTGDTVYGVNGNVLGYLGEVLVDLVGQQNSRYLGNEPVTFVITDHGGIDTIDFSTDTHRQRVILTSETMSSVYGLIGNVGIGRTTVIENYIAGSGNDRVYGNDADNRLVGNGGHDMLYGYDGDDRLRGRDGDDRLYGGARHDDLKGELGDDRLYGGDGYDQLHGGDGYDLLVGGDGNDQMQGGADDDRLFGETGADVLLGGLGNDKLFGGLGHDRIVGDLGDDRIHGEAGDDVLFGDAGQDRMFGGIGDDTLSGGTEDDTLFGEDGNDTIFGEEGADIVRGGRGNDTLYGDGAPHASTSNGGDDILFGGRGDDTIYGGVGDDILTGGAGADVFVFTGSPGNDTITDFDLAEDRLDVADAMRIGTFSDVLAVGRDTASGVLIELDLDTGATVLIEDVLLADLQSDMFIF